MSTYRMKNLDGRTVNGRQIRSAIAFEEGDYWRWRIRDEAGNEYLDGGNYRHREDAVRGLKEALLADADR